MRQIHIKIFIKDYIFTSAIYMKKLRELCFERFDKHIMG